MYYAFFSAAWNAYQNPVKAPIFWGNPLAPPQPPNLFSSLISLFLSLRPTVAPGVSIGGRGGKFLHSLLGGNNPLGTIENYVFLHILIMTSQKISLSEKGCRRSLEKRTYLWETFRLWLKPWGGEDTAEEGFFFSGRPLTEKCMKTFFPFCPRKFLRGPTGRRSKFGKIDNTKFRTKDAFVPLGSLI